MINMVTSSLDFNPILFHHLLEQLRTLENNNSFVFYPPSSVSLAVPFKKMLQELSLEISLKSDEDVIVLNVDDEVIRTRRKTLSQVPNSKLATIVSSLEQSRTDANDKLFFDYDPKLFRHLLVQLRKEEKTDFDYFDAPSKEDKDAFDAMLIDLRLNGEYHDKNLSCIIYSKFFTVKVRTTTTRTTTTRTALPSQCSNYTLNTDGTRNAGYSSGNASCDN